MDPQVISAVRILMIAGGTWLANHGYGSAKDMAVFSDPAVIEAALGIASLVGGAVWALVARTRFGVLKTASKVLGNGGVIITDKDTAAALPHNVVSSIPDAAKVVGPGL